MKAWTLKPDTKSYGPNDLIVEIITSRAVDGDDEAVIYGAGNSNAGSDDCQRIKFIVTAFAFNIIRDGSSSTASTSQIVCTIDSDGTETVVCQNDTCTATGVGMTTSDTIDIVVMGYPTEIPGDTTP